MPRKTRTSSNPVGEDGSPPRRVTVDIGELVESIDHYAVQAGIPVEVWQALTYPQKLLFLAKKGIAAANSLLDEADDDDEDDE